MREYSALFERLLDSVDCTSWQMKSVPKYLSEVVLVEATRGRLGECNFASTIGLTVAPPAPYSCTERTFLVRKK